jgi:hypothetical protein
MAYLATYFSVDNGANWTTTALTQPAGIYGGYAGFPLMEYPSGTLLCFGNAAGSLTHIVTSTDYGRTWSIGSVISGCPGYHNTPFFPKTDGSVIMSGWLADDNIPCWYHSTDWASSWDLINGVVPDSLVGTTVLLGDLDIAEVVDNNNGDTVAFYDADPTVRILP